MANNKKIILIIITLFLLLLGTTYAYFTWSGGNTDVTFNVGSCNITYEAGTNITGS